MFPFWLHLSFENFFLSFEIFFSFCFSTETRDEIEAYGKANTQHVSEMSLLSNRERQKYSFLNKEK